MLAIFFFALRCFGDYPLGGEAGSSIAPIVLLGQNGSSWIESGSKLIKTFCPNPIPAASHMTFVQAVEVEARVSPLSSNPSSPLLSARAQRITLTGGTVQNILLPKGTSWSGASRTNGALFIRHPEHQHLALEAGDAFRGGKLTTANTCGPRSSSGA
jgi:hypothetical protein